MNYVCMYFLSRIDDRVERAYVLWICILWILLFVKKSGLTNCFIIVISIFVKVAQQITKLPMAFKMVNANMKK